MELNAIYHDDNPIFHRLTLATDDILDGIEYENKPKIVCFIPRGTHICLPINMGRFLNDGIYVETAYQSHVRTFTSRLPGSRRVVQEFGFFQLTLLMSDPIYNDVRKKIYRILAFISFMDAMNQTFSYHNNNISARSLPYDQMKLMYELL